MKPRQLKVGDRIEHKRDCSPWCSYQVIGFNQQTRRVDLRNIERDALTYEPYSCMPSYLHEDGTPIFYCPRTNSV